MLERQQSSPSTATQDNKQAYADVRFILAVAGCCKAEEIFLMRCRCAIVSRLN
jgi:hypothetical protein